MKILLYCIKYSMTILIILLSVFTISCDEVAEDAPLVMCTTVDDCPNEHTCLDGFCKKDSDNPIEKCMDNSECPGGFICDDNQQCVQKLCDTKEDCGHGKICLDEKCIVGCENNSDCDTGKVCNTDTKQCEEDAEEDCRLGAECEQGYECNQMSGRCVVNSDCINPEDCADGYECISSQCVAKIKCTSNEECSDGEVCRADEYCGPDTGCDSDDYCIDKNPAKPACSLNSGLCYQCIEDEQCTGIGQVCDTMTHTCGDTNSGEECQVDSNCGMNQKCNTATNPHECVDMITSCTSDNDCQNGMHCKSDGRCVQCLDTSHCVAPKECNINTNFCEEDGGGGGTGDGNQVCASDPTWGPITCLLSGGECDANGDCIVPEQATCEADTCSAYPNTHCELNESGEPSCYCNDGYTLNDAATECIADNIDLCDTVSCSSNATCNSSDGVCYCNTGYHKVGDNCVADDPCDGVTCGQYGTCINETGAAVCDCTDGYHAVGLDCIENQVCDVDSLSNPLNNTSDSAKSVDLAVNYINLSLSDDTCGYVEDWYEVQLYASTEFKADLSFIDSEGDIDITLYNSSLTSVASAGSVTDNEAMTYDVLADGIYYIKVYILSSSNTLTPSYSMTLSTRAIQAGNPGGKCSDDTTCYGDGGYCVSSYTPNGYCTSDCISVGDSCMDTGVCADDDGNCFKKCTIGSDSSCGRTDLICIDGGANVDGICIQKCDTNSDCYSNYCNTSSGRCEINYTTCDDDPVINSGCGTAETCFDDSDGLGTYCYPNEGGNLGDTCVYADDCKATYGCVGNDTDGYICQEYCRSSTDCLNSYDICTHFTDETYGYCN